MKCRYCFTENCDKFNEGVCCACQMREFGYDIELCVAHGGVDNE